ncbi:pyridoxamine 5'-phosphate oxidase family protein [Chloroflexota bacterium]
MKEFKDCIEFANQNPMCYMATNEGDQPRVRAMGMYEANEKGFTFHTGLTKALAKQLASNQKIEVIFHHMDNPEDLGTILRVSGIVQVLEDTDLRGRILEDRPFLKEFITGPEDKNLHVFRIYKGEAYFWTMADNGREAEIPRINFGN